MAAWRRRPSSPGKAVADTCGSNVEQFRLYKPIRDFVERHLDELQQHPEQDFYNRKPGNVYDEERDRWSVYMGIRFFDIMITQALYQGIEWHMWLYYFPPFVERMVRNYQSTGQRMVRPPMPSSH